MSVNLDYTVFDFEWRLTDGVLYCAGFVDTLGNRTVYHLADMEGDEKRLLRTIIAEIDAFPLSMAFASTFNGSDLATLHKRCIANNMPSIVEEHTLPKKEDEDEPEKIYSLIGRQHIDIHKIFAKPMIKTSIFDNAYRTTSLNDIALALLGRGKTEDITGANAEQAPVEKQKEYCLNDAQLAFDLLKSYDGKILDLMDQVAQLTNVPFVKVCNTNISAWIQKVLEDEGLEPDPTLRIIKRGSGPAYKGGNVIDPITGFYENVKVVDVASLYPSMIINYNLSPDTVNCVCCPENKFGPEIINDPEDPDLWWCLNRTGKYVEKMKGWRATRLEAKRAGNDILATGLKILLNGSYGTYGNEDFKFSNRRVAKLTTATGRYTQLRMKDRAPKYGFSVIYGDTDSLFFNGEGDVDGFLKWCKEALEVEVEFEKTFKRLIITAKKNYFGLATAKGNDKIVVKGMAGKKQNYPKWVNEAFDQFVKDFCYQKDPIPNLKKALLELYSGNIPAKKLMFSVRLSKNPAKYKNKGQQVRIANQTSAKKGDVVYYFKTIKRKGKTKKKDVSRDPKDINYHVLRDTLIDCVEDSLNILKIDFAELRKFDPKQTSMFAFC